MRVVMEDLSHFSFFFKLKDNCFTEFSMKPQHESATGMHVSPPF